MRNLHKLLPLEIKEADQKNVKIGVNHDFSVVVPIINNVPYFNEVDFYSPKIIAARNAKILDSTRGSEMAYESFIRQKSRRPNYDIYACFQSFNEAFKAFFPFIKTLQRKLQKGDNILNLWDRTGWLGSILQGLFPDQNVISLWEGDKDVLGYKGFHFWFKDQQVSNNINIGFANLDKPLPFNDNSIAFVFGLDAFHRFDQSLLLKELLRITTDAAPIIFPHVHLSNNEPEPFFERGCRQLHGLDYDAYFQHLFHQSERQGFVFPEPKMFSINELSKEKSFPILSQPNSHHYNSLIAILPKAWTETEKLEPYRFDDIKNPQECYILVNPLLHIDFSYQTVRIDRTKFADQTGYLLDRHPIYMEKLSRANGYRLSELQTKALYLADKLKTVAEISEEIAQPLPQVLGDFKDLQERDVIQLVPVNKQQIRLQKFITTQEYILPETDQTINALWDRATKLFGDVS